MKKRILKAVSTVIASTMILSMASCSLFQKVDKEAVIDAADYYAKAISKMSFNRLHKATKKIDKDVEEDIFNYAFNGEFSGQEITLIDAIADTIRYTVDEDTVKGDKESATVDIIFSMVDYEAVFDDDDNLESVDTCVKALENSEDRIEITVTAEFAIKDDKYLVTNFDDFEEVYDFMDDVDVDFEMDYQIDHAEWYSLYDDEYYNVDYISYDIYFVNVDMAPEAVNYKYYLDDELVYSTALSLTYYEYDLPHCYCDLSVYSSSQCDYYGYLAEGTYRCEVYDEDDVLIDSSEVDIVCDIDYSDATSSGTSGSGYDLVYGTDGLLDYYDWYNDFEFTYVDTNYICCDVYFVEAPETLMYQYYWNGELIYTENVDWFNGNSFCYCYLYNYYVDQFDDSKPLPEGEYTIVVSDADSGYIYVDSIVKVY